MSDNEKAVTSASVSAKMGKKAAKRAAKDEDVEKQRAREVEAPGLEVVHALVLAAPYH